MTALLSRELKIILNITAFKLSKSLKFKNTTLQCVWFISLYCPIHVQFPRSCNVLPGIWCWGRRRSITSELCSIGDKCRVKNRGSTNRMAGNGDEEPLWHIVVSSAFLTQEWQQNAVSQFMVVETIIQKLERNEMSVGELTSLILNLLAIVMIHSIFRLLDYDTDVSKCNTMICRQYSDDSIAVLDVFL